MKRKIRRTLVLYDALLFIISCIIIFVIYPASFDSLTPYLIFSYSLVGFLCVFFIRFLFKIYEQIWRYARPQEYIRLIFSDAVACILFLLARVFFPQRITFVRSVSLIMLDLLDCIAFRLMYQMVYQKRTSDSWIEKTALKVLKSLI